MEKIISFSIAAYNIEKYAEKLLDSFLINDSVLQDKIEVLIINDGSKDKTADICGKYVSLNPKVFKLINKENGGHGSTINRGIDLAVGKYFKPIDGDDWVDSINLPYFIKILEEENADLIISDYTEVYQNSNKEKKISFDFITPNKSFMFHDMKWKTYIPFHAIFYKSQILKDNSIKLSEHVFFEDTEFDLLPMPFVKSVFYINKTLYCYRLEREGQSCSKEGILKHIDDLDIVMNRCFIFAKENKDKKSYYELIVKTIFNFFYHNTLDQNVDEKRLVIINHQKTVNKRLVNQFLFSIKIDSLKKEIVKLIRRK